MNKILYIKRKSRSKKSSFKNKRKSRSRKSSFKNKRKSRSKKSSSKNKRKSRSRKSSSRLKNNDGVRNVFSCISNLFNRNTIIAPEPLPRSGPAESSIENRDSTNLNTGSIRNLEESIYENERSIPSLYTTVSSSISPNQ